MWAVWRMIGRLVPSLVPVWCLSKEVGVVQKYVSAPCQPFNALNAKNASIWSLHTTCMWSTKVAKQRLWIQQLRPKILLWCLAYPDELIMKDGRHFTEAATNVPKTIAKDPWMMDIAVSCSKYLDGTQRQLLQTDRINPESDAILTTGISTIILEPFLSWNAVKPLRQCWNTTMASTQSIFWTHGLSSSLILTLDDEMDA